MKPDKQGIFGVLVLCAAVFSVFRLQWNIPWVYFLAGVFQYVCFSVVVGSESWTRRRLLYRIGNHIFIILIIVGLYKADYLLTPSFSVLFRVAGERGEALLWVTWYCLSLFVGLAIPAAYEWALQIIKAKDWQVLAEAMVLLGMGLWTLVVFYIKDLVVPFPYYLLLAAQFIVLRIFVIKQGLDPNLWGNYLFYFIAVSFVLFDKNDIYVSAAFYILSVILGYGIPKMLFPTVVK